MNWFGFKELEIIDMIIDKQDPTSSSSWQEPAILKIIEFDFWNITIACSTMVLYLQSWKSNLEFFFFFFKFIALIKKPHNSSNDPNSIRFIALHISIGIIYTKLQQLSTEAWGVKLRVLKK